MQISDATSWILASFSNNLYYLLLNIAISKKMFTSEYLFRNFYYCRALVVVHCQVEFQEYLNSETENILYYMR